MELIFNSINIIIFLILKEIHSEVDDKVLFDYDTSYHYPENNFFNGTTFTNKYDYHGAHHHHHHHNHDGIYCSCQPQEYCNSGQNNQGIDIRIVTPPVGVTCPTGTIYCCKRPYPHQDNCGVSKNIDFSVPIAPGQAKYGEFPWVALITNSNNQFVCTGALIDRTHVLTTAHQTAKYKDIPTLIVRLGEWDIQGNVEPYKPLAFLVSKIVIHPAFDSKNLNYDVAVLTLSQPVPFSPNLPQINTICLPISFGYAGEKCTVAGWGKDKFGPDGKYQNIMKKVDVSIINSDECQLRLQSTRLGRSYKLDKQSFVCAGGEMSKDACTGDGGSPLACRMVDGRYVLIGLVSWGIGCGTQGVPGVYTNIPAMLLWIQSSL